MPSKQTLFLLENFYLPMSQNALVYTLQQRRKTGLL